MGRVTNWANVLYADNYWQTIGGFFVPTGQSVSGAYNRKLVSLSGGYSSPHSDVHLWYHGTIELTTPASDTGASISATQRTAWWTADEMAGAGAGFRYSLIGGGNRLSNLEPGGAGNGRISDGFNKAWDLGAGLAANRTSLPANAGLWPNAILFKRADTNAVPAGQTFDVVLHHQAGPSAAGQIGLEVFLDADLNPYNGNEIGTNPWLISRTGPAAVAANTLGVAVDAAIVIPGSYAVCARVTDGSRTRHLYAPQMLTITPSLQPPAIDAASLALSGGVMRFNVLAFPGQQVTVMASGDLVSWLPLQTHTFSGTVWAFEDAGAGSAGRRFYKAVLAP